MYFSHNQFLVFDKAITLPGLAWTKQHFKQGFVRRHQQAAFRTLHEFGEAELIIHLEPYRSHSDEVRVIEIPFFVSSGEVVIAGPEESANANTVVLANGHYRLVAGQALSANAEAEAIYLFFQILDTPLKESRILLADQELEPSEPLSESADVA